MRSIYKLKSGFAALLVVIIIGATLLVLGVATSLRSIHQLTLAVTMGGGSDALAVAEAGMDEAFGRLRLDQSWGAAGSVTITLPNGSGIITVSDLGGSRREREVIARSTVGSYYKVVGATLRLGPRRVTILSYGERSD